MKIVDTHVHIWDLSRADYPWLKGDTSLLNQTWNIEQLEDERKQCGVTSGVLVQASGNIEDTELMLETAAKTEWIKGVVCWLPLMHPERTQRMLDERYLKEEYCKGIRHQIHDEKDPKWLLQPPVIESLKILAAHDLPFDLVAVLPSHIEAALEVAGEVPGLRMVFDHLSQPPISTGERFGRWGDLTKEASKSKNFYAKISGLGTASGNFKNRVAGDVQPYTEFVLKHFGIDRCFCGSDWPVSLLANTYTGTWQIYKNVLKEMLAEGEQEKVFCTNAVKFYDLRFN